MGFIKRWLRSWLGIESVKREYPEKIVESDVDYRGIYEQRLIEEINYLRSIVKPEETEYTVGNSIHRTAKTIEDYPNVKVPQAYTPFSSIRSQVEKRLREKAKEAQAKNPAQGTIQDAAGVR